MRIVILIYFLLQAPCFASYGISVQDLENFEDFNQISLENKCPNTQFKISASKNYKKKYTIFSNKGRLLKTKLRYNPFSNKASIAVHLDLIDCYYILKAKPKEMNYIPYCLKYLKKDLGNQFDLKKTYEAKKDHYVK